MQTHEPLTFILSTIGSIGSVYSLVKKHYDAKKTKAEMATATKMAVELKEGALAQCQALAHLDATLVSRSQGLLALERRDPNGKELDAACRDTEAINRLHIEFQRRFQVECEALRSTSLTDAKQKCEAIHGSVVLDHICESVGGKKTLFKQQQQLQVQRLRLDGLLSGMCDSLTEFRRLAPRVDSEISCQPETPEVGLLQRGQSSGKVGIVEWAEIISLAGTYIGLTDVGLGFLMPDASSGYSLLLNILQDQQRQHKEALCQSVTSRWLEFSITFAWMYTMQLLEFQASKASFPEDLTEGWVPDDKSDWVCSRALEKLVPIESVKPADVDPHYPLDFPACWESEGKSFRITKGGDTTIAPKACFTAEFRTSEGKRFWALTFATSESCQPYANLRKVQAEVRGMRRFMIEICEP